MSGLPSESRAGVHGALRPLKIFQGILGTLMPQFPAQNQQVLVGASLLSLDSVAQPAPCPALSPETLSLKP